MIEELKMLIEALAHLPDLALWVAIGFLMYKLAIIGSVFGVIHFAIEKAHHYFITRKTVLPISQEINLRDRLNGISITSDETISELLEQIRRIRGKNVYQGSTYIHLSSVDWLRQAINAKEKEDIEKENKNSPTETPERAVQNLEQS